MKRRSQNPLQKYLGLGLIALLGLVGVGVVVFLSTRQASVAEVDGPDPAIPRGTTSDGLPSLGEADAPVVMRIYEDVGCPNCRNFFHEVEPAILETFVKTGQVRLEIYTLAFVNAQSLPGAEALACAAEQGKFWEYRALLFDQQGVQFFDRSSLVGWAEELGLARSAFASCFDQAKYQAEIIRRSQQAYDVGVTGTPTLEVNGTRHVGVIPFESSGTPGMREILETALQEAGG